MFSPYRSQQYCRIVILQWHVQILSGEVLFWIFPWCPHWWTYMTLWCFVTLCAKYGRSAPSECLWKPMNTNEKVAGTWASCMFLGDTRVISRRQELHALQQPVSLYPISCDAGLQFCTTEPVYISTRQNRCTFLPYRAGDCETLVSHTEFQVAMRALSTWRMNGSGNIISLWTKPRADTCDDALRGYNCCVLTHAIVFFFIKSRSEPCRH